ncbi:RRBP1 [Acanthosepion pharaonis]|uniref:RRBP1 n=1 Tax=Acanthosepion pharaonis TaxID=158019 RepID=A0A812DWC9_ACAPH|nr:RRBP1 [Sepia pharaonis]
MMNLSKRVEELEEELGIVKQKNMILLEENKLVHEKPVKVGVNLGERQEPAGAPNGDVQQESLACTKVALVEHERLLGEKQSEIVRLTAELGNKETETKARVDEKESEIQTLTSSLNTQIGEIEKLREEIQAFKNKNDELRKRNWKAMEAVEKAEKSAVEKISNAVKNTMQCQSLDKSVLMRIFPDISVTESLEHDIWLKSFEVEAVNYIKGLKETSESVRKLEKAEMMKKELEIRLNELEKKLSEAQISKSETVEDLHKQIDILTAQLKDSTLKYTELQTNSEETKTKLEDRLKELKSAFSETKTLCMSLKEKLENAPINNSTEEYEKQVDTLMVQLKESNETVAKLETQVKKYQNLLKVTDDKLQVLQRSVEDEELKWRREQQTLQKSLMEAQQELEELRKNQVDQTFAQSLEAVNSQTEKEYKLLRLQVEEDEKKVRDLSQTIVKLNGIIKTGQDALSQEQELVCKLKQQLAEKNSTESPSAAQEVEELKKKLAQKEKEVEQGQLYNNALSQKLAQLGVMVSW